MQEKVENDADAERLIFGPVMQLLAESPWFRRRDGMDHIFVFADGQGPRKSRGVRKPCSADRWLYKE